MKVATFLSLTAFCLAACGSANSDPVNVTEENMGKAWEAKRDSTEIVEEADKNSIET